VPKVKLFEFSISTDCGSCILVESITRRRKVEPQPRSFSISALYRDECLTSHPGRFNPSKYPRCPLNRRLCGPQRDSRRFQKRIIFYAYLDLDPGPSSLTRNSWTNCTIPFRPFRFQYETWLKSDRIETTERRGEVNIMVWKQVQTERFTELGAIWCNELGNDIHHKLITSLADASCGYTKSEAETHKVDTNKE
jgi:hypothetical protein